MTYRTEKLWEKQKKCTTCTELKWRIAMSRTIDQKKKDVLHAATKLFAEKGFEATTMSDIAKLSNVGFGSVASYYENKETLLFKYDLKRC